MSFRTGEREREKYETQREVPAGSQNGGNSGTTRERVVALNCIYIYIYRDSFSQKRIKMAKNVYIYDKV